MKTIIISFTAALVLFLSAGAAVSGTVDISSAHDAQVVEGQASTNFGSQNNMYLSSAAGGSYKNERAWIKFNLEGRIPAGATITSATLRLYCFSADDEDDLIAEVYGSEDSSWDESSITWDTQPATLAGALDSQALQANNKGLWIEWDVTGFVAGRQAGDRLVSLMVRAAEESSVPYATYAFDSKEYTGSLAPRLRVEYSGDWPQETGFKIFHINDAHSRLVPHEMDVPERGDIPVFEKVGGAAYLASEMIQLKAASPNSLVLDAGDISEGNPLGDLRQNGGMIDFYSLLDTKLRALGGRGIDAVVVGNHDVRYGDMITNMLAAPFPFISMNLYYVSGDNAGSRVFPAYVTVTVNGKKVGILGYTNDESSYLGSGTEGVIEVKKCVWTDTDEDTLNIRDIVSELRSTQGCDMVILLSHMGQSRVVSGDDVLIEASGDVAPPEVVISGHWHSITDTVWQPAQLDYRTIIAEAASYMQYIGELEIDGSGRYVDAAKHVIRNADITPDPDVDVLIRTLVQEYNDGGPDHALDEVIGYSAVNLSMDKDKWWTLNEYPWSATNAAGAWITDAMKWKAQQLGQTCDLAIQSGGGIRRDVPAGWINYLQIYETYPWQDDNMVVVSMKGAQVLDALQSLNCGASISNGWQITADDGVISEVTYNGSTLNSSTIYQVAISRYMAEHESEFSGTTPVDLGYSIREAVVDYTRQFTEENPLTIGASRYTLNTEFSGGFKAVVTMMADSESQPYYEAAFVRLLDATDETLARRADYGLNDLIHSDGSVNKENQFSEIMLYRSHLGFQDDMLQPGDIIEIWGEGGFYAGNPQFIDQNGIVADQTEFAVLGHDASLAEAQNHQEITSFMDDAHENHLITFYAKKTGQSMVEDAMGDSLTLYQPGGHYTATLPGDTGDLLKITGVVTMRFEERRFRLRDAVLASDAGITGFPPASEVDSISESRQTTSPLVLSITAQDALVGQSVLFASTGFEEPGTGSIYTDTGDAGADHALSNNSGQMPVNYTSTGGELGFATYYTNTRDDVGLTDGDYTGVTAYTSLVESYPEGSKGFEISDSDGLVTVTLDSVELSPYGSPRVQADVFIADTGWESSDRIRIWAEVDGGAEIDLLNTTGQDIDDMGIEGNWITVSADLSGYSSVVLKFEADSNSASEAVYVDNIRFENAVSEASWTDPVQVEVFYRYSTDSLDWGEWMSAGSLTATPWQMDFNYPQGYGYYEFASRATDADANTETLPLKGDTRVQYADSVNNAPDITFSSSLPDGSTDSVLAPTLTVTVSDPDQDLTDVYFYDADGTLIQVVYNVASGQSASVVWNLLSSGTTYGWYVIADDGISATQSGISTFTTASDSVNSIDAVPVPAATFAGLTMATILLFWAGLTAVRRDRNQ